MAEESPLKRQQQYDDEADPEDGPSESKKPRVDEPQTEAPIAAHSGEEVSEAQEPRDPGKKQ